jgi:hypothetical protein
MVLVVSVVVAVLMAGLLYRLFFKDFGDFVECVRFYFQPDIISMFRGELVDDWWGSTKFVVWLLISLGMGAATFYKLPQLLPGLKDKAVATAVVVHRAASRTTSAPTHQIEDPEETPSSAVGEGAGSASNSVGSAPIPTLPAGANKYGLKVGDTVEISAVNPAIVLRKATVVTMNTQQLVVRSGVDDYTVRWDDIIKVKSSARRN